MNKFETRRKFLLKCYYIGSQQWYGSQRQRDKPTIEDTILKALKKKKYINDVNTSEYETASRTDKSVSARTSVFSFISHKEPILMEINSELPKEIGIWAYSEVDSEFSSRFNALYRHYKYIVPYPIAFIKNKCVFNYEAMEKACKELEGTHNFINFSKRSKEKVNNVKEIISAEVKISEDHIIFDFKSKSFLRQQVRRMVKIILDLGLGKITYRNFLDFFDATKEISYEPADPSGLILWDIKYDDNIVFKTDPKSIERMKRFFLENEILYGHKLQLFKILQQNDL